jgi:hypothetical protein
MPDKTGSSEDRWPYRSQADRVALRREQDAAHRDDPTYSRLRQNPTYAFLLDHQGANAVHDGRWENTQAPPSAGPPPRGFSGVTDLALQPSVLDQDPAFARAMFMRDIARTHQGGTAREQRRLPSGNANQYMIDAILRDNAIAQYDRDAPQRRAEMARARAAQG